MKKLVILSLIVLVHSAAAAAKGNKPARCCSSLADANFVALPGPQKTLRIDKKSPVFAFAEGESHFAAFVIPERETGWTLSIRTYCGAWLPSAKVLFPKVVFLDANKQVTRTSGNLRLTEVPDSRRGQFWIVNIDVNKEDRYFVVYADASKLGTTLHLTNRTSSTTASVGGTGSTVVVPGGNYDREIPVALTGEIALGMF